MPSQSAHDVDVRAHMGRNGKRAAQKTVLEARQRLTSSSGTRAEFDFELMHDYAASRRGAALPIAGMVCILAIISSFWVPMIFGAFWAALVITSLLVLLMVAGRFTASDPAKFNASQWTTSFIAAEMLYGVALSLLALCTLVTDSGDVGPVMFAMVLVSIGANAVVTHTLPQATLMSTLPVTITASLNLLFQGGTLNYTLAAVVVCGEIFFLFLARQLYASELETISHQAEKDSLISELEEARHMSDEARRHAEQANIAKSQFLATMSHELRTPLNAIIGFSEVLKSELLGPHQVPQYKEYAGDIHASGQHLLNLINELLDLSRIEAGKYDLHEEAVSIVDIADDCRRMMELRAKAKGIELVFSTSDNLPKIWGDERAIRQVILNLMSNAIKFTPQHGKVTLVVTRSGDGGQMISVKDNGPGIPESEIQTVLSSFGQGSLAQKTAEQGAGLGLPIVQKIMDLHQGRFDLFSKLRFGTEVIATFPRARVMDALAPVTERRNKLEIYSEAG
ncbi:MAG: HAMP domain-containing histidine kinase [Devosia sp.]|nr:HAMP domain-containing histidine kinase [Devosia sp.]